MTGDLDIDAYWDEYIGTIESMDLDLVLEQAQAAYDQYIGK